MDKHFLVNTCVATKTVRSMSNDSGINASIDMSNELEEITFNNSLSTVDPNSSIEQNSTIDSNSQFLNNSQLLTSSQLLSDSQCCDRSEFVDSGIGASECFSQSFEQDYSVCDDLTGTNDELLLSTQSDCNPIGDPSMEKLENQFHSKELEEIRAMNERVSLFY